MAGGGPGGGSSSTTDVFQARLKTDLSGVSNTLTLLPYKGNKILVNGSSVTVPGAGMTRLVSANLITAAGADSGGAGAANTLYYVYVSNASATFSPSSIRLSASAPTLVNGVYYLGNAGNALNWRFVGWVRLNATPQFESSASRALIVNYYNRIAYVISAAPAYADTNSFVTHDYPAAWGAINGGTGDRIDWVANGEDAVEVRAVSMSQYGGAATFLGVSLNGASPEYASYADPNLTITYGRVSAFLPSGAAGYTTADLWGKGSPGSSEWYSDTPRNGLSAGPKVTYIDALVQV